MSFFQVTDKKMFLEALILLKHSMERTQELRKGKDLRSCVVQEKAVFAEQSRHAI